MSIHHYSEGLLELIIKTAQAGDPLFYVDPYGDVEQFYYDSVKEVLEHIVNEGSMLQLDNFRLYMLDLDSMESDGADPEEEPKETQIRVRADYENGQIFIEALGKDVKICPKLLVNETYPAKAKGEPDPDNSVFMTLDDVKSWLKKHGSRTVRGQFRNGRFQFRSRYSEAGNVAVLYFEDTYGNFWVSTGSVYNRGSTITSFKPTAVPKAENKFKVNDITFKAVVTPKDLK